jgi:hypothetical protein
VDAYSRVEKNELALTSGSAAFTMKMYIIDKLNLTLKIKEERNEKLAWT